MKAHVHKPLLSATKCWGLRRVHTGSLHSKYAGCFVPCDKNQRKGKLTCYWHDRYEPAAQALRANGT